MAHFVGSAGDASRALSLARQREAEAAAFQSTKQSIQQSMHQTKLKDMNETFAIKQTANQTDALFKSATVGLISGEEFQQKRTEIEQSIIQSDAQPTVQPVTANKPAVKQSAKPIKRKANISFDDEDESEVFAVTKKPTIKDIKQTIDQTIKQTVNATTSQSSPNSQSDEQSNNQTNHSSNDQSSDQSNDQSIVLIKSISKNPDVRTDFLPDVARSLYEQSLRETLSANQSIAQTINQSKPMKITYSYWSGTGHRRVTTINQGASISQFLRQVYKELTADGSSQSMNPSNNQFNQRFNKLLNSQSNYQSNNQTFPELRHCSIDDLMLIKEDLIIPHHLTFYQLIVCQARGKSGPLFDFDVHEDVRLLADANNQAINTHAAKVCTKHWFERNKHIFPANRWEVFDINNIRTENYSIKGKEVR